MCIEYRKHVFSYHNILKVIDLNSGILNYASLEVLENVETSTVKYVSNLISARGTMQKYITKKKTLE